uniref:Peptidylprolyl isomerase n=1 Tax=Oryza glumipatula TaxID=40148 RepID=A0A0D9YAL9_9ORYZ
MLNGVSGRRVVIRKENRSERREEAALRERTGKREEAAAPYGGERRAVGGSPEVAAVNRSAASNRLPTSSTMPSRCLHQPDLAPGGGGGRIWQRGARAVERARRGERDELGAGASVLRRIGSSHAFGEQGRPSLGDEAAIPPNATLYVHLKFLSWVRLRHTWEDRTISKKNLSVGNSLRIHKKSQGVVKGEVIDGQDKALMTTKEEVALFVMCALLLIMLLVLLFIVKVLDYFPEKKDVKQERTAQEFLEDSPEVDSAGEMDRGPKVEVILLQAGYCRKLKHGHRHRGNDLFVPGVAGANASQPASTPVAAASAGGGATPATSAATANRNAVQISSGTVRTDRGFSFLCFRSSPTK